MRVLFYLLLLVHALHAEIIQKSDKRFVCPSLVGRSDKHHYEVEKVGKLKAHVRSYLNIKYLTLSSSQFVGLWNGVELYSHTENETFNDTCLRLRITEVNDVSFFRFISIYT